MHNHEQLGLMEYPLLVFDSRSVGPSDTEDDKLSVEHDSGNSDGSSSLDSEESFSEVSKITLATTVIESGIHAWFHTITCCVA